MSLPEPAQMAAAPLSVAIFGMGLGESIVLRADGPTHPRWGVVDSARRKYGRSTINPALEVLNAAGARPELVVLTHPHLDHTKGMADIVNCASRGAVVACLQPLMEPFDELDAVYGEDDRHANDVGQTLLAHAAMRRAWRTGAAVSVPLHDQAPPLGFGQCTFRILHPSQELANAVAAELKEGGRPNLNNVSVALLATLGELAMVLAGDGEAGAWEAVEKRMNPEHLRLTRPLKVPHHGSLGAIHPVLIDPGNPTPGREEIVTPFPQSGTLPRLEPDQGADRLIRAAGELHLTAMPRDLLPLKRPVSLAEAYAASQPAPFAGDDNDIPITPQKPPTTDAFTAGRRDPRECWVLLGFMADGSVNVTLGSHAVRLN